MMKTNLEKHPAIASIQTEGFRSPAIELLIPKLRETHSAWFGVADRVNQAGQRIMNAAEAACVERTTHDPLCIATRLLLRTMSGFQASLILAERGMTAEAETHVRGLYESCFWFGYLCTRPSEAVDALIDEERRSQRGRDKALLAQVERAGHIGKIEPSLVSQIKSRIAEADATLRGKKPLGMEELTRLGETEDYYHPYKSLSSGAAHTSFHSLSRYLAMNGEGIWSGHITGPDSEGIPRALTLGTHGVLACLAQFSGIWPAAPASDIGALLEEHLMLARATGPITGEE